MVYQLASGLLSTNLVNSCAYESFFKGRTTNFRLSYSKNLCFSSRLEYIGKHMVFFWLMLLLHATFHPCHACWAYQCLLVAVCMNNSLFLQNAAVSVRTNLIYNENSERKCCWKLRTCKFCRFIWLAAGLAFWVDVVVLFFFGKISVNNTLLLSIIIVKIRLTRSQLPTCFIERGSNSTATGCVSYYDMRCEHQNNGYNRRKKEEKMCTNSNQLCYISIYLNANINIICRQMKQLLRR